MACRRPTARSRTTRSHAARSRTARRRVRAYKGHGGIIIVPTREAAGSRTNRSV